MLRTFRIGGIHPPENKLSAGKKITALAAPKQVIIPLSQHIGFIVFDADNGFVYIYGFQQQCDAHQYLFAFFHHHGMVGGQIRFTFYGIDDDDFCLASGRRHQFHLCREGGSPQTYDTGCCNLVAKAGGFVSANIHSSVSGKVNKIDNALDSSGYKRPAIYIDVEGDEWEETIDRSDALVKDCTLSSKEIVDKIAAAGIVGLGGATFPTQVKLMPPPGSKAEIIISNVTPTNICSPFSIIMEWSEVK